MGELGERRGRKKERREEGRWGEEREEQEMGWLTSCTCIRVKHTYAI